MRSLFLALATLFALVSLEQPAYAADAYFIRFFASGQGNTLNDIRWRDDILFFSTNATPVDVKFAGVSNGTPQALTPPLTLPPGTPVSLDNNQAVNQAWIPNGGPSLWVLHLDIPAGVVVESRDSFSAAIKFGFPLAFARGKVSMPVFRRLSPPNQPQTILGTDLSGPDSRLNVGIYNGGTDTATATIELRSIADRTLAGTMTVSIPPNVLTQFGGLSTPANPNGIDQQMYTVVTVSQPSLVYVANLNDTLQPFATDVGIFPIVGLAVAVNQTF